MWRYWLRRFEEACEQLTAPANAVVR
jgi:hypothetical protein